MAERHSKSLDDPDEVNRFPGATESLVQLGEWTVARITQDPGWRYSVDMAPLVGNEWCPSRHVGVTLAGRQGALLEDGTILEFGPGDDAVMPTVYRHAIYPQPLVLVQYVQYRSTPMEARYSAGVM